MPLPGARAGALGGKRTEEDHDGRGTSGISTAGLSMTSQLGMENDRQSAAAPGSTRVERNPRHGGLGRQRH
jgi:hypothetical protein